jgi:hypothetical protein
VVVVLVVAIVVTTGFTVVMLGAVVGVGGKTTQFNSMPAAKDTTTKVKTRTRLLIESHRTALTPSNRKE